MNISPHLKDFFKFFQVWSFLLVIISQKYFFLLQYDANQKDRRFMNKKRDI